MKRVMLFGGTFNPPHVGHLTMAQLALEQANCDEVWLLPAVTPPHKSDLPVSPYKIRKTMVQRLISDYPGLFVCDIEEEREEPSYTIDTVKIVQQRHPDVAFRWLIGADSLRDLPTWSGSQELVTRIGFVVAARTNSTDEDTMRTVVEQLPALQIEWLEMPVLDISSSYLRDRWQEGKPLCGLVPDAVRTVWEGYHKLRTRNKGNCAQPIGEKKGD